MSAVEAPPEAVETFPCFGGTCAVRVGGDAGGTRAADAAAAARAALLEWHVRCSRFDPASELSRLNADPRPAVPASPEIVALAEAIRWAGALTGGLVDGTLLAPIEAAGYRTDLRTAPPLALLLRLALRRAPARPDPAARWQDVRGDAAAGIVHRPPGTRLDGGGLVKGLAADRLAGVLGAHDAAGIDCGGDLRIAGAAGREREIHVAGPSGGRTLHTFRVADGGVATSGIGRRAWLGPRGAPHHHLLDPSTGRAAFTGLVQVTALAPTALEAEVRAKAALLGGPDAAGGRLAHGGLLVFDDGTHEVVPASA